MGSELQKIITASIGARGVTRTATLLGLTEESTLRLAGGFRVRAGTLALAKQNAARLVAREATK
jgi:hypothetical protein